jgi:hypothetical protein
MFVEHQAGDTQVRGDAQRLPGVVFDKAQCMTPSRQPYLKDKYANYFLL